jgi:signal transduction histidine kinase
MAALVLGALAVLCAIGVAAMPDVGGPATGYATASDAARAALLIAGAALIAGAGTKTPGGFVPRRGAGTKVSETLVLLAFVVAIAWLAPELEGWGDAPGVVRALAAGAAPALAVALLALAGAPRRVVAAFGAAALAAALVHVLLRDPFQDVYCWRTCSGNALLVAPATDLARLAGAAWEWVALAGGLLAAAIALRRLAAGGPAVRRVHGPVLGAVALAGLAEAAHAAALVRTPLEDPEAAGFAAIHLARAGALALLGAALVWTALARRQTRARVARLAAELGEAPAPGALRATLATALRDPGVDVLYPLPDGGGLVDAHGAPAALPTGRTTTRIARAGREIAVVVHDPALLDGRDLEREIGSAARLAVENEALRAAVLAQLAELRASRTRIVEAGDGARRRLERDLHDGAQQRLLAVALELRLARATAGTAAAPGLDAASAEVDAAFGELRDLAHGIFPAVLSEGGLEAALVTLATDAPVAVELTEVTSERFPPGVEVGAYVTAAEAVRDAAARGASRVEIEAERTGDRLVVAARDDGAGDPAPLVHVADRIGALGGTLAVDSDGIRAELPCG